VNLTCKFHLYHPFWGPDFHQQFEIGGLIFQKHERKKFRVKLDKYLGNKKIDTEM